MFKRFLKAILGLLFFLTFAGAVSLFFNPQFGAKPSKADFSRFERSPQFNGDTFENTIKPAESAERESPWPTLWKFLRGSSNRTPAKGVVQAIAVTPGDLHNPLGKTRILWFGHSTFLVQLGDKNYLFDPVFADVAAPYRWMGSKRYSGELPISPEQLPDIDAVFISHDHYDHLDMNAIKTLNSKTRHFYTPLGVGAHLKYWGVDADKITEMDWWQETTQENLQIAFTSAQHFSGRSLINQKQTLWGSWLIRHGDFSLYFSGDTGYSPHFKEIFQRYGQVDFALLECGQYNPGWADIHMMPEQTVQAAKDLHAKIMMPVHWGAFTLSLHDWYEPAERVTEAAEKQNQAIVIPQMGEMMIIEDEPKPRNAWWEALMAGIRSKNV